VISQVSTCRRVYADSRGITA